MHLSPSRRTLAALLWAALASGLLLFGPQSPWAAMVALATTIAALAMASPRR